VPEERFRHKAFREKSLAVVSRIFELRFAQKRSVQLSAEIATSQAKKEQ